MRGLLVGRFQPFHKGHLAVVREIRAARPESPLLLGIGSAQLSHTPENPFTAGERFEMIVRALVDGGVERCEPVPLADVDRHAIWVSHLESLLPRFDRVYSNNPLTRTLFEHAGYTVESPVLQHRGEWQGTVVRQRLARGEDWASLVPPAVAGYLREIHAPERVRLLTQSDGLQGSTEAA